MKLLIAAMVLGAASLSAQATPADSVSQAVRSIYDATMGNQSKGFEVKARSGSKRVGGTNKSGKGSTYKGGRK